MRPITHLWKAAHRRHQRHDFPGSIQSLRVWFLSSITSFKSQRLPLTLPSDPPTGFPFPLITSSPTTPLLTHVSPPTNNLNILSLNLSTPYFFFPGYTITISMLIRPTVNSEKTKLILLITTPGPVTIILCGESVMQLTHSYVSYPCKSYLWRYKFPPSMH